MPSKERLLEIYEGLDMEDTIDLLFTEAKDDNDYINNYFPSQLWRLNNLYVIVDKSGIKRLFTMNDMQHQIHAALLRHPRVILLKSRQIGGSTYASIRNIDDGITTPDLNIGLMAQGKDEAATLLGRIKTAWENFPDEVKALLSLVLVSDNKTEYKFNNGSTIFIRTSFRSATLQRLWISEFAKISVKYPEKAKEVVTGTLPAIAQGNPVLIESTAERGGRYQQMWDESVKQIELVGKNNISPLDFLPLFIGWTQDPSCRLAIPQRIDKQHKEYFLTVEETLGITLDDEQKWFYVAKAREQGEDVTQEYPSTPEEAFKGAKDGAYYSKIIRKTNLLGKRVVPNLYDDGLDVFVAMDLGINDEFVMVFFQVYKGETAPQYRIIHMYGNSGEGIEHYVNYMEKLPYKIAQTWLPHDAKVKDLSTGKTRVSRFRELGVRRVKVLPRSSVELGIEQVRKMIPHLWIDEGETYAISALMNYTKEWDEARGVWKDKPLHNKWSNPADAIRYMAMAINRSLSSTDINAPKRQQQSSVYSTPTGFAV